MTEKTWTDETQKGYEAWERAHGNEPPPVKLPKKEVKMVTKLITKTGDAIPLTTEKPKRTRRPKGTAPGITVETQKIAYIDIYIPERPVGMNAVYFHLRTPEEDEVIEWPEGVTDLQALAEYFNPTGTMKIPGETNGT